MGCFEFTRSFVRRFSSIPSSGLLKLKTSNSMVIISGPDATKFLNGLLTIRLLPTISKTRLTTVSNQEGEYLDLAQSLNIAEKQVRETSWGILHDDEYSEGVEKVGIRRDGRYGMLLSSKGRVDSDLFVYPIPFIGDVKDSPSYLVEFNSGLERFRKLFMLLKLHKLRTCISINHPPKLQSWVYFNRTEAFEDFAYSLKDRFFNNKTSKSPEKGLQLAREFLQSGLLFQPQYHSRLEKGLVGFAIDNRSSLPMFRLITDNSLFEDFPNMFSQDIPGVSERNSASRAFDSSNNLYELLRIKQGLVEMSDYQMGAHSPLPFEFNIDYANGINYNKGCYIGQELTSRTWTRGVIRKRIMPANFFVQNECDDSIISKLGAIDDLKIVRKDKREKGLEEKQAVFNPFGVSPKKSAKSGLSIIGAVIRTVSDAGLVLVNIKDIDLTENDKNSNVFCVQSDSVPEINGKVQCQIRIPDWWPIEDEIE